MPKKRKKDQAVSGITTIVEDLVTPVVENNMVAFPIFAVCILLAYLVSLPAEKFGELEFKFEAGMDKPLSVDLGGNPVQAGTFGVALKFFLDITRFFSREINGTVEQALDFIVNKIKNYKKPAPLLPVTRPGYIQMGASSVSVVTAPEKKADKAVQIKWESALSAVLKLLFLHPSIYIREFIFGFSMVAVFAFMNLLTLSEPDTQTACDRVKYFAFYLLIVSNFVSLRGLGWTGSVYEHRRTQVKGKVEEKDSDSEEELDIEQGSEEVGQGIEQGSNEVNRVNRREKIRAPGIFSNLFKNKGKGKMASVASSSSAGQDLLTGDGSPSLASGSS